ncbi:hypothetical protein DJ90_4562 [Paenibacillus macerans]|uniref:Uncharacterized protein n=1 Tax=Paenibacillus macerans TaxID=44252 RepID=A0A090Z9F6_PAEMA|nr:hypothetical protein DJ90_4562 [Paenibacillus macerans]
MPLWADFYSDFQVKQKTPPAREELNNLSNRGLGSIHLKGRFAVYKSVNSITSLNFIYLLSLSEGVII